jgi:hypothetical protein
MAVEISTLQEMFEQELFWDPSPDLWPVKKGDEIKASLFEVLRRWVWLLFNPRAGNIDLSAVYGHAIIDTSGYYLESMPYTRLIWPGNMVLQDTRRPGQLWVYYEDSEGVVDLYVNCLSLNNETMVNNPPITDTGKLSSFWKLAADPNKYHHFDFNAGRPSINATHRWRIIDHPESNVSCGQLPGYTSIEQAYRYYPKSLDYLFQTLPIKRNGSVEKIIQKVEITKEAITKWPRTHHERSLDTSSYEPCKKARALNEYVLESGEPWREDHPTHYPNYVDKLVVPAVQDQIVRACESLTTLAWPSSQEWLNNFIHYNAVEWSEASVVYEYGDIVYVSDYNPNLDYPDTCFFICKKTHTSSPSNKPAVAGNEWWHTPAYETKYTPYNIEFHHTQDIPSDVISDNFFDTLGLSSSEYADCNGSCFELCLKNLGEHDWWLDVEHPFKPYWMYKFQKENPGEVSNQLPSSLFSWRRTWKHSMGGFDNDALIWPGELGFPPGYWAGRDEVYKRLNNRFPISRETWNAMTNITNRDQHYRVLTVGDVEALYEQARLDHGAEVFDELLTRHDAVKVADGVENFEIHHDLLNHCRYVLAQLRYVYGRFSASITRYENSARYRGEPTQPADSWESTPLQAFRTAKNIVDSRRNFMVSPVGVQTYDAAEVGINGEVDWDSGQSAWTGAYLFPNTAFLYGLVSIKLYEGSSRVLPSLPNKGIMMFHLAHETNLDCTNEPPASGRRIWEPCEVGVSGTSFKPSCDTYGGVYPEYAFVGGRPSWEGWYTPDSGSTWQYWVYYWLYPAEPWMDESYFASAVQEENWDWWKQTEVSMVEVNYIHGMIELDLNTFDESVFDEDLNNYIEVT